MTTEIFNKQKVIAAIGCIVAGLETPAWGAEANDVAPAAGFYGGIARRDHGIDGMGLQPAGAPSAWARFTAPTADDASARALVFGGYRWGNDVAVEASFSSLDKYALRPADSIPDRRGVGLGMATSAGTGGGVLGLSDAPSRSWNLDVYTSWAFYKTFSLYGRLGYGQADAPALFAGASLTTGVDPRRLRDGVNYGVGLRYNIKSDLGLRVEYARFARPGADAGNVLPESDQVSVGLQFRF